MKKARRMNAEPSVIVKSGGVMNIKAISSLVIALAIATSAFAQRQQQIPAPTVFSIRAGETLQLTLFVAITADCASVFTGFDRIDILDGPPEITLKFEPDKVTPFTQGGKLCKPVAGGRIMITASKDITEPMEADLTYRVRYRSKQSNSQEWTGRNHLLLFPAGSGEQPSSK